MNKIITFTIIYLRRSLYVTNFRVDHLLHRKNLITILCYHGLGEDTWQFSIDTSEFQKQMLYLKKHYQIITLEDVVKHINGKKRISRPSVVLTFDDGYKDVLAVKELLRKFDIRPAIFVLANNKQANRKELNNQRQFLTDKEILSLYRSGWTIGCHSGTHANLGKLSEKEVAKEVIDAKKTLEKKLHIPIKFFAYPKGKYSPTVLRAVQQAGYLLGLSMDDDQINQQTNYLIVPRVGVHRTHSYLEFQSLFSPLNMQLRKKIKQSFLGGLL